MLTKKEAWQLLAKTFVESVTLVPRDDFLGKRTISRTSYRGICWRIGMLFTYGYISSKTMNSMYREINSHIPKGWSWLSPKPDTEARALFCMLMVEAEL